ncbi:hypothetical protein [Saccharicrinis sp. GN24d3]|uniref:hypothetical protein n=1 Tax=Saccharicrinis sp. GN24d3 TaxID=3458416 RepID=UPI0040352719
MKKLKVKGSKVPVYLLITVDGRGCVILLKRYINPEKWDNWKGKQEVKVTRLEFLIHSWKKFMKISLTVIRS